MNNQFIGNTTLTDALLSHYTKPFDDYSSGSYVCNVTPDQRDSLIEIRDALDGETAAMASGVEAIGHLMAIGGYEDQGLDSNQLVNMGWLLAHLGKKLSSNLYSLDCLSGQLENAVTKVSA